MIEGKPVLAGLRVLAVDDNFDSRELLVTILMVYGAQAIAVASAQEVLATIVEWQPNLLISDLQMPEYDGCSLIQQIRSLPPEQGGQIPAIALSGSVHEKRELAIAAGFQRFLLKPIEPEHLIEVITELGLEARL
jgi:CheY-like chemotaxis protein